MTPPFLTLSAPGQSPDEHCPLPPSLGTEEGLGSALAGPGGDLCLLHLLDKRGVGGPSEQRPAGPPEAHWLGFVAHC
jgi:hypothetical protein